MAERRAVGLGSSTGTGTFGRHARGSVGRSIREIISRRRDLRER